MIKKLSSKEIYRNKWLSLHEDQVEFANGHQGIYGVVEQNDYAIVVPYENGYFHMIKQFRYPTQKVSYEFPQGKHEGDEEQDMSRIARSELQEETGIVANKLEFLGMIHDAPGYSSQASHIFLASELTYGEQHLEITESDLEVVKVSVSEFEQMILGQQITCASTIAAYTLIQIGKKL